MGTVCRLTCMTCMIFSVYTLFFLLPASGTRAMQVLAWLIVAGRALVRLLACYASSGHHCIAYIRGRDWLCHYVDFTYRSIPFLLSCMEDIIFNLILIAMIREARGAKSGVVVCTDVVF
jgi:hypothetical protein